MQDLSTLPEKFWGRSRPGRPSLTWRKPFKKVLSWKLPHAKWFEDGRLNVSENTHRTAMSSRSEGPTRRPISIRGRAGRRPHFDLTYRQLHMEVCRMANALTDLGLGKGDRAAIYMPMVPEAAIAMLACARLGIIHTWSSSADFLERGDQGPG